MAVLHLYILQLFSSMTEYDYSCSNLLAELMQFLIPLFDLLVKSLIFDLELFEIDQMQAISKLLLLLEDLLLVSEAVAQCNVLETELSDLLVLLELALLLHLDVLLRDLLACATVHSILCNTALEFFELGLDLLTLGLLLIQLSL